MNIEEYREKIINIINQLHSFSKLTIIYNFIIKISGNGDH